MNLRFTFLTVLVLAIWSRGSCNGMLSSQVVCTRTTKVRATIFILHSMCIDYDVEKYFRIGYVFRADQ